MTKNSQADALSSNFGVRKLNNVDHDELVNLTEACCTIEDDGSVTALNLSRYHVGNDLRKLAAITPDLKILRLFDCDLTKIPDLGELTPKLEALYVGKNQIETLDPRILDFSSLSVLGINSNPISSICPEFEFLPSLKKIGLSTSSSLDVENLNYLPASLTHIYFKNCEKFERPPPLAKCKNLEELSLQSTGLKIPQSYLTFASKLETVDLSSCEIENLASLFHSSAPIRSLILQGSTLGTLGRKFRNLNQLVKLDLTRCQFPNVELRDHLPSDLQILSLCALKLKLIPFRANSLPRLKYLNASKNSIKRIPVDFSKSSVRQIDLSRNKVESIPVDFYQSSTLHSLDLSKNKIQRISNEIMQYKYGFNASPAATKITAKDDAPRGICLTDNPLISPPYEVLEAGRRAARAYFESLKSSARPVNTVKVLFVGDGGAGKTSLINLLCGRSFNPHESATHGIQISETDYNLHEDKVTCNFWDFGGQEIMHATHQLFLSKRSVYVLVVDARKDEKTEYWLKHIESFGGSSPILIVMNKMDENPSFDLNRNFLREKYPSILGFLPVSCAGGDGIEKVERTLRRAIFSLDSVRELWPESWGCIPLPYVSSSAIKYA